MAACKRFTVLLILCLVFSAPLFSEIYYPWKEVYIGALDGNAWGGLVVAPGEKSFFAFRFKFEKENQVADKEDLFFLVSEVGPRAPDGAYARIKFDLSLPFNKGKDTPVLIKPPSNSNTVTLEWTRQDEKTVLGRIRAPKYVKLHLVHYFPWDFSGRYQLLANGQVRSKGTGPDSDFYLLWTHHKGKLTTEVEGNELGLVFSMEKDREIYFVAGVGKDPKILNNRLYRYKNKKAIDYFLKDEEKRYQKKRLKVENLYEGVEEAVTNNLFWMILYQPLNHRLYTPAGRRWIFPKPDGTPDNWTIFEWDSFFNALEAAVESSKHAREIIRSVLETQYSNGNIPNWRGHSGGTPDRSQPPVGSYVVLKLFQRFGDLDFLKFSYPYLRKWHSFWKTKKANGQVRRDGNGDGLLEWGSDSELLSKNALSWEVEADGKQRAMWESGQDDLPNWDEASFNPETGTLTMNCIDLNSLYALDSWCLAQIARFLNRRKEYSEYLKEYEEMKKLINTYLWDDLKGFYFDRHWNGKFSTRKAASNFYPLLARIPDRKQALKMIKHLLNPKEFWGEHVIPTISRDDSAYKDQQYWRGTIWPPINYLVYQGLKIYGFDAIASEFARRSSALFLRSWKNFQICPENYDSRTGEAGGQRYQSWGPLLGLIALEEYLDFTPWEGFRFGMINPEKQGKLSRVYIQGRHYEVSVSSSEVKLKEEDREIFKANGGAVIRQFLYSEEEVSFIMNTLKKREVKIQFLEKGKYQLLIDDELKKVFKGKSVKFDIPQGNHSILIQLLERKG